MCYQPIALWVRGGISKSSSKDDFPNMELVIDPPQDWFLKMKSHISRIIEVVPDLWMAMLDLNQYNSNTHIPPHYLKK